MHVLDTDVMIDALHGSSTAASLLKRLADQAEQIATTSVNAAELLRGARRSGFPNRLGEAEGFLSQLKILGFGLEAARRFGAIASQLDDAGRPVDVPDIMIAASCVQAEARLVTRNAKDFVGIENLEVLTLRP